MNRKQFIKTLITGAIATPVSFKYIVDNFATDNIKDSINKSSIDTKQDLLITDISVDINNHGRKSVNFSGVLGDWKRS